MAGWGYAAVIGAALLAAALVLWQRRQSRKILENLGKMLEAAMEGNFTEASFDESLLSALESSFAHYLAASTVSARKVDAEKEKLKALIGDISHQTKTPIANILLYTQLLKEQPGNTDCPIGNRRHCPAPGAGRTVVGHDLRRVSAETQGGRKGRPYYLGAGKS